MGRDRVHGPAGERGQLHERAALERGGVAGGQELGDAGAGVDTVCLFQTHCARSGEDGKGGRVGGSVDSC